MTTDVQGEIQSIPIGKLKESTYNPRRHFDKKQLADLIESVKAKGVINPILVRPQNGHFEIIGGARRYRAAKEAGLAEILAIVRDLSDQEALEVAVIDNLQRADVHPLDEAEGFAALLKQPGYDVGAIASKVGKSPSYVYQRLKLADLVPSAKQAFFSEQLTAGHAVLIARLQPKDQKEMLDWLNQEQEYNGTVGVRELGDHIAEEIHLDLNSAPFKKDDSVLHSAAGPCTTCPKRTGTTPELFPDVKKKDTCLDRSCFAVKLQNWKQQQVRDVEARGEQAGLISEKQSYEIGSKENYKGVLTAGMWHEATKKCKEKGDVHVGIAVDGKRIGQEVAICVSHDCSATHAKEAPDEARWRREREKRNRAEALARKRQERENQLQGRVFDALSTSVKKFTREDLEKIGSGFFEDVWYERRKRILSRRGWNQSAGVKGQLKKLTEPELMAFILEVALSRNGIGETEAAAKRHGVDVFAIRKAFNAEVDGKKKKTKKK